MYSTEIYVLDSSEGALSEDYLPNRLTFQHDAVRTLSRALLAPRQGTASSGNALAVVSYGARPSLLVPPTSDATSILTLRQSLGQGSCTGGSANFLGALRLALLTAKRSSGSSRVVAFLASPALLPEDQCHEVSARFAEARVSLDVVVLCPLTLTSASTPTSSSSASPSRATCASATTHTCSRTPGPDPQLAQAGAAATTQQDPQGQSPEALSKQHQQAHTAAGSGCSSGSSLEQLGTRAADCGGSGGRGVHAALQVEGVGAADLRALRSLTSHHAYGPLSPTHSLHSGTRPRASAGHGMGRSAGPAGPRGRTGAGLPAGGSVAGGASASSGEAGGTAREDGLGGQRLVLFPPPDPTLALWQQLEPLLEALQSEGAAEEEHTDGEADGGEHSTGSGGRPSTDRAAADPAAEAAQDAPRSASAAPLASATARPIPSTTASRFPPRPPPHPHSHRAHRASAVPSTGPPSSSTSTPGLLRPQPPSAAALVPSGPLPSRMRVAGGRGITPGSCRYESLDSLQHLSTDGFLRSWLPSYANLSRVWLAPTLPGTPGAPLGLLSGGSGSGAGAGSGAAGSQQGGEAGASRGGRQGGIGGVTAAGGPGRLCYISVYRLQLPKWHKLLEVKAGCTQELPAGVHPPPLPTPAQPAASSTAARDHSATAATAVDGPQPHTAADAKGNQRSSFQGDAAAAQGADGLSRNSSSSTTGALASLASDRSTTSSSTGDTSTDAHLADAVGADAVASAAPHMPPARPAVPRAPCPVAVHFTTLCSSAAAAASGGAVGASPGGDGSAGIGGATWVCPDPRRGTLTLVAAVEDPSTVKLLWSERTAKAGPHPLQRAWGVSAGSGSGGVGGDAAGCGPPPQESYSSIFPSAEDPGDGGVDVAAAEMEVTLSPTRSRFSLVPHVHGGTIIEVRNPRSVVVRRRQQQGQGQGQPASPAASDGGAAAAAAAAGAAAAEGAGGATPREQQQAQQQQLFQPQRVFFWLQQEWPPRKGRDAQDATPAEAATAAPSSASTAAAGGAATALVTTSSGSLHTAAEGPPGSTSTFDPTAATLSTPPAATPTGAPTGPITSTAASIGSDVAPAPADGVTAAATVQPASSRLPPYQPLGNMGYRCTTSRAYGLVYGRNASGHGHVAGGAGGYGSARSGGARALVEELQSLLECPPEFNPHKHGNRVRCSAAPLQLGPLPLALVEEIMRASGRALNPDGTVTPLAPAGGGGGGGSGGSGAPADAYPHLQHPSNRRRSSGDSEGGRGGRRYGAEGAGGLALGRSPGALAGNMGLALAERARRSAGQVAAAAAAAVGSTAAPAGAAAPPSPTLATASAANTGTATAAATAVAGCTPPHGPRDAGDAAELGHTAASPFTASVAMAPAAAAVGAARSSALLGASEAPHVGTRAATPAGGASHAGLRPREVGDVHAQSAAQASASGPVVRSHPICGPWWEEEEEEGEEDEEGVKEGGEQAEAGMRGGLAGRRQGDCKQFPDSDDEVGGTRSGVMSPPRNGGSGGGGGGNAPELGAAAEGARSGRLGQAAAAEDEEVPSGPQEEEVARAREHVSLPDGIEVGASVAAGSRPHSVRSEAAAVVAAAAAAAPTAASLVAAAVAAAAAMERKDSAAANEDASLMFELD